MKAQLTLVNNRRCAAVETQTVSAQLAPALATEQQGPWGLVQDALKLLIEDEQSAQTSSGTPQGSMFGTNIVDKVRVPAQKQPVNQS